MKKLNKKQNAYIFLGVDLLLLFTVGFIVGFVSWEKKLQQPTQIVEQTVTKKAQDYPNVQIEETTYYQQ